MTIVELKNGLDWHPGKAISIQLPEGELIPSHFDIAEINFLQQEFSDGRGQVRVEGKCILEVRPATAADHRVNTDKLARIFKLRKPVLPPPSLPVEVEFKGAAPTRFPLSRIRDTGHGLLFELAHRPTEGFCNHDLHLPATAA